MPRLWTETIAGHRRAVRDAIMEATVSLVARDGLRAVTMSQIASEARIGRATLYKYFPDVDAILLAWHRRQLATHVESVAAAAREGAVGERDRLAAVLEALALAMHESHGHRDAELTALVHRDEHVRRAERQLQDLIRDLVAESAALGAVRSDVAPDELARFCIHALSAARSVSSGAAVRRLVAVTLDALRPRAS